ncbi:MAG: hypothetical protein KGD57_00820, partial [Candidatus Lokiarchaeota archaeon]|nr:hypothetical protein [Candidatus Lokiarchaeota archaeon]
SYDGNGLETNRSVMFWDFAGQTQFRSLWKTLLEGTDITLLVTDSTFENLNSTKEIIQDILNKYFKDTRIIGIANKQDLPNRLSPEFCQKIFSEGGHKIRTYDMIAINENYKEKMHAILNDAINQIEKQKLNKDK